MLVVGEILMWQYWSSLYGPQLASAHSEDWTRFARTLMEIRANRADGEEEGPVELAS